MAKARSPTGKCPAGIPIWDEAVVRRKTTLVREFSERLSRRALEIALECDARFVTERHLQDACREILAPPLRPSPPLRVPRNERNGRDPTLTNGSNLPLPNSSDRAAPRSFWYLHPAFEMTAGVGLIGVSWRSAETTYNILKAFGADENSIRWISPSVFIPLVIVGLLIFVHGVLRNSGGID
jgi:hypothetical protein